MIDEKIDDFIGKEFPTKKGGVLKVVGKAPKTGRSQYYYCECSVCSKDKEMFPDYFLTRKSRLVNGILPCGCTNIKLNHHQFYVKLGRMLKENGHNISIVSDESDLKGYSSTLELMCHKDNFKWNTSVASVLMGSKCPKCSGLARVSIEEMCLEINKNIKDKEKHKLIDITNGVSKKKAIVHMHCSLHGDYTAKYFNLVKPIAQTDCCTFCKKDLMGIISRKEERKVSDEIEKRCMEAGYTFSHFTDGCYKGKDSKLVFRCDLHGDQTMSYHNFIYHKQSCPVCASFKRNRVELDSGIGKYSKDRPDNLYIIKFNNDYIKVGRTFNMVSRVSALKRVSKIKEIDALSTVVADHAFIYNLEHYLHNNLKEGGLWADVGWSTECFKLESLPLIPDLIERFKETYGK